MWVVIFQIYYYVRVVQNSWVVQNSFTSLKIISLFFFLSNKYPNFLFYPKPTKSYENIYNTCLLLLMNFKWRESCISTSISGILKIYHSKIILSLANCVTKISISVGFFTSISRLSNKKITIISELRLLATGLLLN